MWSDILVIAGFIVFWYILMRYLLPALGIPTCMSGACQLNKTEKKGSKSNAQSE
ncbi:MAG TPA: hypothetical protein PK878_02660 [bacterium]|nr:hypothetical protein [Candidatus Omnitrophota bacterium]HOJ59163.1 hypothetical protein [bacterium]HOL92739.1 hypothetical protein [bacterium]HPO99046.1 hypothetical protein [bacterium]HXK95423.1 hypothetical protein [bacterium]